MATKSKVEVQEQPASEVAAVVPAPAPVKVSPNRIQPQPVLSTQMRAFAMMVKISEGTFAIGDQGGYDVLVGSSAEEPHLFTSFADHPRVLVKLPRKDGSLLESTAAGAYQILEHNFDVYRKQLGLVDFSPAAQDIIMLQMVRECRATAAIEAGLISAAISMCCSRWASFPGANYAGQHMHAFDTLLKAFQGAGGQVRA